MKQPLLLLCFFFNLFLYSADFNVNDKVVFVNELGKFATANQNQAGEVVCRANHIGPWETFKITKVDGDKIYFEDCFNNQLYINQDGIIEYGKEKPSPFYIQKISGRNYLRTADSLFIDSNDDGLKKSDYKNLIITNINKRNSFNGRIKNSGIALIILGLLIFSFLYYKLHTKSSLSKNWMLFLIFLASSFINFFAIDQFDILGLWDEQFHALVGKNLSEFPLVPLLYKSSLFIDSPLWTNTTVWLHKQPLFLYQMALSIKLFGASEFAVRFPSMILMSACGVFIYRMGKLIFNDRVGLTAAAFFALCAYKNLLLMGFQSTDHNDLAFLAYITASAWAYVEYEYTNKRKNLFLVLIGIFSGFAILNKWLVGFFVYLLIFFTRLIYSTKKSSLFSELWKFRLSFIITLLVAVPWQIYILIRFPEASTYEYGLASLHLFEAVEGHSGDWDFYLKLLPNHYGLSVLAIVILLAFALISNNKNRFTHSFLLSSTFVFLFFSIAKTKMMSFTFIVSPFIFILMADGIESAMQLLKCKLTKKIALTGSSIIVATAVFFVFNLDLTQQSILKSEPTNHFFARRLISTNKIKSTDIANPDKTILFNCGPSNALLAMFYLDVAEAYEFVPNQEQVKKVLEKNLKVAVYNDGSLPVYLKNAQADITLLPNY